MWKHVIVATVLASALVGKANAATMYFALHGSDEAPFLGNPLQIEVQHSWSEAWSWYYGFNSTESWMSGIGRCDSFSGVAGCKNAYRGSVFEAVVNNTETPDVVMRAFDKYIPGIYLVNGVCHQATNRALQNHTSMKRVVDYNLKGAGVSQSVFGTCGKLSPWGFGLSCPN